MNKIVINEYLIKYEFLEIQDRVTYNTNVFLIHINNKGILLDTGYIKYTKQIIEDLKLCNINLEYIIISHYHRDHAEGSVLLKKPILIASKNYESNLTKCQNLLEGDTYKIPDILVDDNYELKLEGLNIKIFSTPGHTPCSLSTLINSEYLHVSDLILEDFNRKIIIPYIDLNSNPTNHLSSLNLYKTISFQKYLLTHGEILNHIDEVLEPRIFYLTKFIESNFTAQLTDCLYLHENMYSMKEIHKLNIRHAKKLNL